MPQQVSVSDISQLNGSWTFESFIKGSSNLAAYEAALMLAVEPAQSFLYVWGGIGVGKTHLLHAIGNSFKATSPAKVVCYRTAERFANGVTRAAKAKTLAEFNNKAKRIDLLLLDDIQFLQQTRYIQEQFFQTLCTLSHAGKSVVVASNCPPDALGQLKPHLKSKLASGLTICLGPLDPDLKRAIVAFKAELKNLPIPLHVVNLIANKLSTSREIEGVVNALVNQSSIARDPVDTTMAESALSRILSGSKPAIALIERMVAQHYKIRPEQLRAKSNSRSIVLPRQIVMYLSSKFAGLSLSDIARHFSKHHTTVLHAVETIERARTEQPALSATVRQLESELACRHP